MKILGLCGSLREGSSNGAILKSAAHYFSDHHFESFDLSKLPYFDPDQQFSDSTPSIVAEMREIAKMADLIFISTPEYAHGVPGLLKNGLEWLFCEGTMKKKVAVVIGSAQGEWVRDQLLEILKTMDFVISENQFLLIKGARNKINKDGQFLDTKALENFNGFCHSVATI